MIQSAAVIFIVVALAYIWGSRGFFSALLHMVCVLVAGAIAFGLWEPISYFILARADNKLWLVDLAWGAGLALPFAVSLAIIRKACDKLVPANCDLDGAASLVGGLVCGAVTGTITAGILLITISFLRLSPEIAGSTPVRQEANGSPVINDKLIFPADRLTAWLYGYASEAAFRTGTPLAKWRPTLPVDGALMRTTFNEGGARHTLTPKGFTLTRHFTVGKDAKLKVSDLLTDGFGGNTTQNVSTIDGDTISQNSTDYYIAGYVVNFSSAAREKEGAVVIGNTQVQLVCHNEAEDKSISLAPVSVSSKAEPTNSDDKRIRYGRWRFERPDTYIRTVGGTDEALMGFEFLVPLDYTPIALYVKGVREDLTRSTFPDSPDFADKKARDKAIEAGTALGGEPGTPGRLTWDTAEQRLLVVNPDEGDIATKIFQLTNSMPYNRNTTTILSKDNIGGLKLNEERQIIGGEEKYKLSDLQKNRGIDAKLQVRTFYEGEDTMIVQVNFSKDSAISPVNNRICAEASGDMALVDERGESYPCVGFVYFDNQLAHIRFTPESIVRTKEELPSGGPSKSRPDQQFILLFRVSRATKVNAMQIGQTKICELRPPLATRNN